jgi:hypothetical protein
MYQSYNDSGFLSKHFFASFAHNSITSSQAANSVLNSLRPLEAKTNEALRILL